MYCRNYTGTINCVLYGEVYSTLSLFEESTIEGSTVCMYFVWYLCTHFSCSVLVASRFYFVPFCSAVPSETFNSS